MHENTEKHLEGCEHCRRKIPFDMPVGLIDACKKGEVVIFAGAGISTEGKGIFPFSFYDEIRSELSISEDLSFPDLMSRYVSKTHDNRLLLNRAKSRIDYSKSFPDLYSQVSGFHRELSTIHQIQEIITTNWDDFFEVECAATPIVTDKDFAFWDQPFRKVFKIHGSINNPGSVVATNEDYQRCYKELSKSGVGGALRHLLATKTIIFVGYSFGDYDFNRVYKYLHKTMGNILPHSYFVSLSGSLPPNFKEFSSTILKTDATFFLQKLKEELVKADQMLPDSVYPFMLGKLLEINRHHYSLVAEDTKKNPSLILCGSYQDGVIHALEKILQNKNGGQYSHVCRVKNMIETYFKIRKKFISKKRYFDVAYIDGYIIGLMQIIPEIAEKIKFPLYYVFNSKKQLFNFEDYIKESKKAKRLHKASYSWAEKMTRTYEDGMILQHSNFLMGISEEDLKD